MSGDHFITDRLDLWAGAITVKGSKGRGNSNKIELTGLNELRILILELAVRGKLVPQSPEDISFRETLQQLRAAHSPAKTRGRKTVSGEITEDEKPFSVPKSWAWTRLGEITEILDSQRKPITKAARKSGPFPYYGASGIVDYVDGHLFDESLVLVGEDGAKWDKGEPTAFSISGKTWVNNHAHVLRPKRDAILDKYLVFFLTAADLNPYITGMTVPKLNQGRLSSIPVATPRPEEQQHIVQKVDELMALCDRLEQQTSDQIAAHDTLVDTLLGTLTQSQSATELAENWTRLAAHFDTLFTTEKSIDKLKQTILQLAVMGRLVEQDSGDEPATAFLQRLGIKSEPYFLNGWAEVTLGDFGEITGGSTPSKAKAEFWNGSIPWVSPKDMKAPLIIDSQDRITEKALQETTLKIVPAQSILMVIRGMILAHSFPVAIAGRPLTINQDMKALIPPKELSTYILLYLQASKSSIVGLVERSSHGTCKLVSKTLWSQTIHIPPLEEQHRIVQKVDDLMALCDRLKKKLNHSIKTQCLLAEAIAKGAIQ